MKISLNQSDLNGAIQTVQKAVSSKSLLPVLSGILITVEDGFIDLQSTDLELSMKYRIPVNSEVKGSVVIPARLTGDIVKNLSDGRIDIQSDEKGSGIKITCGLSTFNIKSFSTEDFPKFPELQKEKSVQIKGRDFSEIVRQVIRAVSKDETRPILSGIFLTVEKGRLKMVSTDSYRLSIRESAIEGHSVDDIKVIVPSRCLDEVSKICGDRDIEIGLAKNQIYFNMGDVIIVSRLIEGQFPNYQQLLPADCELRVKFKRDDLISSLKRVSLLAQNNALVKMRIADKIIKISAMTQDIGSADEEIETETEGDGMEIAYNAQFLIDGLNSIGEEEVFLELNSPLKPGLVRPAIDQNFIYLIMPVRIG